MCYLHGVYVIIYYILSEYGVYMAYVYPTLKVHDDYIIYGVDFF